MSNYRPYPKTKDSGVEWLGDVPEMWEHLPGRRIFEQRRDPARPADAQLSATQKYGVIPQALFMEQEDQKVVLALGGIGSFKHVEEDDFVISLRSFQGGIEHSAYPGCVSPAYTVLRSKRPIAPRYCAQLLKCRQYIAALQAGTDGIREGKSISYEQFGQIPIPVPPLPEQIQIAAFLDRECGKLDALQAKQQRLIELLKEKRQALISHAVTRGLDPTANLKPSGIEWLGDVPEHWVVARMKQKLRNRKGAIKTGPFGSHLKSSDMMEGTIKVYNQRSVIDADFSGGGFYITEQKFDELRAFEVEPLDVLVTTRGTIGRCAILPVGADRGILHPCLIRVQPSDTLSRDYLQVLIEQSGLVLEQLKIMSNATTIEVIYSDSLKEVFIPVPPLSEQRAIVAHLDDKCGKIDQLKAKAERGIELLKERRSALISAAVTGKIDVRDV